MSGAQTPTQNDVRNVLAELLAVQHDALKDDAHLVNDLGMDSLDAVELVLELEELANIEISDSEAEELQTVADVMRLVGAAS